METIFDIEQKQNSQEMLDYASGKPTKFFLFADEFNDVARKALEAAVHDVKLDFSWSNKPEHRISTPDGVDFLQLLVMDFRAQWMLENTDEVWLIINRYKPKKADRLGKEPKYKESGFKHAITNNLGKAQRPSEILISQKVTPLYFGQQYYFSPFNKALFGDIKQNFPTEIKDVKGLPNKIERLGASGYGSKNKYLNGTKAWTYLQFSIKVVKGDNVFYSNPKATIQMICQIDYSGLVHISYKLK